MDEPRVSLVVVSYNYARFLRAAVDSALRQTYGRLEIIAVDDGSTDESQAILTDYAERVTLLFKPNGGETSTVNAGFAATRGDIVMFLDSDDVLDDTAVAEVVAAWRSDTAKVQFPLAVIDGEGRPSGYTVPVFRPGLSPEETRRLVLRYGIYPSPPTSGNAYARSFLERVMPIDTTAFPFAPDGALNTIAPLYGDVRSIARPLGYYRIHGRNMWASTELDAGRMLRYIALGMKEAALLRQQAARLGVALVECNPLDHSLVFLERRLAAVTLEPAHPLVAGDVPMALFWRACRCLRHYEPPGSRRALKLAWFLVTALSPRPIARRLLHYRFSRNSRPLLIRRLAIWFSQTDAARSAGHDRWSLDRT